MSQRARAISWTAAQYLLLLVLVFGGRTVFPPVWSGWSGVGWALITAAGALTGWAVWAFRATRLHLTPLVRLGGSHIMTGPYRWVRHPMYTSVLLLAAGFTAFDPTWVRMVAALLMLPVIVGKLTVEEELLLLAYPSYAQHITKTKRLIPGVW